MAAGSDLALLRPTGPALAIPTRFTRRAVVLTTLVAGDAAVVLAADQVGALVGLRWGAPTGARPFSLPALSCLGVYLVLGLYAEWGSGPVERLRTRGIGLSIFVAVSLALSAHAGTFSWPIALLAGFVGLLMFVAGHYVEEGLRTLLATWRRWGVPVALIGAEEDARALAVLLRAHPKLGLRPVGLIGEPTPASSGVGDPALPFLGELSDAPGLSQTIEIAIVIESGGVMTARLLRLPFRHVVVSQGLRSGTLSCPRVCSLGGAVGFNIRRDIYRPSSLAAKRCLDLTLALPMLIASAPVMLLLALLIKLLSPGPVLFRQRRQGHNGRAFEVLKFRTMYVDAARRLEEHLASHPAARQEWERFYKLKDDPRIIPGIGHLMRRASLDELPQLFNVVRGEMSLVGPRPFPEYHLKGFDEEFRALRASVPPGLTGFWQISARSDGDLAVQQVQDSYYIANWSFWLDLYVVLQTPIAVLGGTGAR